MERLPEHCPGPPGTSPSSGGSHTDYDLSKELQRKEEELGRLRDEIQGYVKKLKGYQTLGYLLQESKQECAGYKQQNDELARKLESLMNRLSLKNDTNLAEGSCEASNLLLADHLGEWQHVEKLENSEGTNDQSAESTSRKEEPAKDGHSPGAEPKPVISSMSLKSGDQLSSMENCIDMKEIGKVASPEETGARSSSASSPSFVKINSTEDESAKSLVSGSFGDADAKEKQLSLSPSSVNAAQLTSLGGTGHMSLEAQLLEHLNSLKQHEESSGKDLSSDLIRSSLSVLRLEKRNRLQKVMMEQMSTQLSELQSANKASQVLIQSLQEERAALTATVKHLETVHNRSILDARSKSLRFGTEPSEATAGLTSGEWVQVEKSTPAGSETCFSKDDVQVTTVSAAEVELRRRVEKLSATVNELVTVNRNWDEHCKKLELSHSQQVAALQSELSVAHHHLDDSKQGEQQRQENFDQLLLSAKKQREAEEMAKEDALMQLHVEQRLKMEAEQRCIDFSLKTAELEARIRELQTTRNNIPLRSGQPGEAVPATLGVREQDMMTELEILREQVTVFKEDFDQERRDREAARTKMEKLQSELQETNAQLNFTRTKLFSALDELKAVKKENTDWRSRFQKVVDEVKTLQRQVRQQPPASTFYAAGPTNHMPVTSRYSTPTTSGIYVTTPTRVNFLPPTPRLEISPHDRWSCMSCTFINPGQRTTCEICGNRQYRNDIELQPRSSAVNTGGGSRVAGLHGYPPSEPVGSPWPPLAHGSLETDKPLPE